MDKPSYTLPSFHLAGQLPDDMMIRDYEAFQFMAMKIPGVIEGEFWKPGRFRLTCSTEYQPYHYMRHLTELTRQQGLVPIPENLEVNYWPTRFTNPS